MCIRDSTHTVEPPRGSRNQICIRVERCLSTGFFAFLACLLIWLLALFVCLFANLFVCLFVCLLASLLACLFSCLFAWLFDGIAWLFICLFACLHYLLARMNFIIVFMDIHAIPLLSNGLSHAPFQDKEPQISNQWVHKNAHAVVGTGMYLPALVLANASHAPSTKVWVSTPTNGVLLNFITPC